VKYGAVIVLTALVAGGLTFVATDQSEKIEKQEKKIESLENQTREYENEVSKLEVKLQEATEQEKLVDYFPSFESENVKFRGLRQIEINQPTSGAGDYDGVELIYQDGEAQHTYYVGVFQYEYASDLQGAKQSVQDYLRQTSASDTFTIVDGNTLITVEAYQGDSSPSYRDQIRELKSQYE